MLTTRFYRGFLNIHTEIGERACQELVRDLPIFLAGCPSFPEMALAMLLRLVAHMTLRPLLRIPKTIGLKLVLEHMAIM